MLLTLDSMDQILFLRTVTSCFIDSSNLGKDAIKGNLSLEGKRFLQLYWNISPFS